MNKGYKSNRIEICGNIASGKTTLAQLLVKDLWHGVFENFSENPFYEIFYSDPSRFSFETEITFHLQHYHLIKTANLTHSQSLVCDFSLHLDRAYASVTLNQKRAHLFEKISEELEAEIGPPSGVIYLNCSENVLLDRIRSRARMPERNISIEYLSSLSEAIKARIEYLEFKSTVPIIYIDSENLNYARDPLAQSLVLDMVADQP